MKKIISTILLTSLSVFVFGQSITLDPRSTAPASVVVKGDLAIPTTNRILPSGGNNNLDRQNKSVVVFETGTTLGGIQDGQDGLLLYVLTGYKSSTNTNNESQFTILHEEATATATHRIRTHTGADFTVPSGKGGVLLIYDGSISRWRVIETVSSDIGWALSGNAGTTSVNFLGTTDAQPLKIKTNNSDRITIESDGDVGIGTTNPNVKLHVYNGNASIVTPSGTTAIFEDNTSHSVGLYAPEASTVSLDFGKPSNAKQASISLDGSNYFSFRNNNKNIIGAATSGNIDIGDVTNGDRRISFFNGVEFEYTSFNGGGFAFGPNTTLNSTNTYFNVVKDYTVIRITSVPVNCKLAGIPAPTGLESGVITYIIFDDADVEILDESASETNPNSRIYTGAGGSINISGNGGATFMYIGNRWRLIGYKG